jgi:hypothetical protein
MRANPHMRQFVAYGRIPTVLTAPCLLSLLSGSAAADTPSVTVALNGSVTDLHRRHLVEVASRQAAS